MVIKHSSSISQKPGYNLDRLDLKKWLEGEEMEPVLGPEDRKRIRESIRQKYAKVSGHRGQGPAQYSVRYA